MPVSNSKGIPLVMVRLPVFTVRTTAQPSPESPEYRAGGGDSYKAVIEFGEPVRAQVILTYGNASQPGSPHRTDQLELYSKRNTGRFGERKER